MIVVDTNVLVYLLAEGAETELAEKVREVDSDWAAPLLWRSEMRNVLVLYFRSGIMNLPQIETHMAAAEKILLGREYEVDSKSVLLLAAESGCTAYDCEFVSLAERLRVPLVTADKKVLTAFPVLAMSLEAFVG